MLTETQIAACYNSSKQKSISEYTACQIPQQVPLLSAQTRMLSLSLAQQNQTGEDWKTVCWSDESGFLLPHADRGLRRGCKQHESIMSAAGSFSLRCLSVGPQFVYLFMSPSEGWRWCCLRLKLCSSSSSLQVFDCLQHRELNVTVLSDSSVAEYKTADYLCCSAAPFLRSLHSGAFSGQSVCQSLEQPNIVTGLPAAGTASAHSTILMKQPLHVEHILLLNVKQQLQCIQSLAWCNIMYHMALCARNASCVRNPDSSSLVEFRSGFGDQKYSHSTLQHCASWSKSLHYVLCRHCDQCCLN